MVTVVVVVTMVIVEVAGMFVHGTVGIALSITVGDVSKTVSVEES